MREQVNCGLSESTIVYRFYIGKPIFHQNPNHLDLGFRHLSSSICCCLLGWCKDNMSGMENVEQHEQEAAVKKRYGGIMPKKPPLISKDHERAYFDSADWALGKQGVEKPKGPLEALRPKLQPTQQQTRYRKSPYAPSDGEDGGSSPAEDMATNE
ncbi:hypothetical protein CK203_064944 [Vitis vinifera]|uniref:cAMP-regulated phosphoprotein 19-related protein n=1 Tax=Vitis vinifera TaxID=29760 RepID=A0A438HGB0_VITVI|nr:hypothetical protein CK203_064944 [Vitis vinifera]